MIYVEEEIADHQRTRQILKRLPDASHTTCESWRDVFDRPAQNFRLQKKSPALILARREDNLVRQAPSGWRLGGRRNFTVSPMLNCIYDCRYCYLQGRFRSAAYVIFVNYEDYMEAMDERLAEAGEEDVWFFTGDDCDSLAFEPVSRFVRTVLPFFEERPRAWLELRTKSSQVKALLRRDPIDNCVAAYSLTPAEMSRDLENLTPALESRLAAARRLQEAGWKVGLRFDPLLWREDYEQQYRGLFDRTFEVLDGSAIHSVTYGLFRLPRSYWQRMKDLYPDSDLFAGPVAESDGTVSYRPELAEELREFCRGHLAEHVPEHCIHPDALSI